MRGVRMNRSDVALFVVILGASLIVAGCWLVAGEAWGLITGGVATVLIGLTVIDVEPKSKRGERVDDATQ
jgi:uncharacterized membrane protein (UPF0136 family)